MGLDVIAPGELVLVLLVLFLVIGILLWVSEKQR